LLLQVEEAQIQIQDPELRKILKPTVADLRFADYLVKHVTENRDDVFLDGTGWEGGDEWIRAQFTLYLHSLLSSALQQGRRICRAEPHILKFVNDSFRKPKVCIFTMWEQIHICTMLYVLT